MDNGQQRREEGEWDEKRTNLILEVQQSREWFENGRRGPFGGAGILADAVNAPAPGCGRIVSSRDEAQNAGIGQVLRGSARTGSDRDACPVAEPSAVQVRSDFRSTFSGSQMWSQTPLEKQPCAVQYPDSLTAWKATARAFTSGNQVGIGQTNTQTKQPLIVRLQAPRFFLVGDLVTVSAVINNNTTNDLEVTPSRPRKASNAGLLSRGK